jgi:EAL domain-containing protein (putative c-di-GMP-specific phosphodiesterase class I)
LESGLPPQYLELELTESILMENVEANLAQLQQLKALGVSIALDDFGTGASSLAYLKDFPVDSVKLCQSFVINLPTNDDDRAIASAVISLAQGMHLTSVAEGVENEQQAAFLRERKCDYLQGYLFSQALPAEEMEHFLRGEPFSGEFPTV